MFVCDSKDNKSYLCDINETIFASRWSFHQKNPNNWATWNYGTWVLRLSHVFIFIIHLIQQTGSDVCLRFKSYLSDTNETTFASRWRVFIKKTQITQQHGITECEYCVYLTFSFSLITSVNRQEVMFVCYSKDNKNYLRDTNETIFASRWRVFIKKKTNNWAAWNYRTRVLRLSHVFIFIIHLIQQTGSDVCLRFKSYLSDTNETTFASRWRVFIKKIQITQQHGITEREYCVYLPFSFSLFTSFNRQEVMFVSDSKDNKSYLRDTNKTNFASRWRVFFKNPHNSAAWNYRTWVLRLSHVFIFNIQLIQQTGSDVCLRFEK